MMLIAEMYSNPMFTQKILKGKQELIWEDKWIEMSTREFFEARYRRIAAEYGPDIAALHYEFPHGYPQPRIHGRIRHPLPPPLPVGSVPLPEPRNEEPKNPILKNLTVSIKGFTLGREMEREEEMKIDTNLIGNLGRGMKRNKNWDEVWERENRALEASIDKWDRISDEENAAYEREFDRKYKGLNYSIFPLKRRK
jgi:hypothetical protein